MSHRVTTKTEMKDVSIIASVCKAQGIQFNQSGDSLAFTSGPLRNARLNLKTGDISGDTDHGHTETVLGALRQAYSLEKVKYECARTGSQIESETKEGEDIVLYVSMG